MRFDLTNLSAGQIALVTVLLTIFGSLIAAIIAAIGATVTAWVNGHSNRRLDHLKAVREAN